MRKVQPEEILPLTAYEAVRDAQRAAVIAHKKLRRVLLGPEMSVLFEDRESVRMQVQEMLRAEKITDPAAVRFELDTYNEFIPPDGALRATLMIEVPDPGARDQRRRDYVGLDAAISLELGARRVPGVFAPEGIAQDKIAVVQYVTFALPADGYALLRDGSDAVRLLSTHPRYHYAVELSAATRRALAQDLDPANAALAPSNGHE